MCVYKTSLLSVYAFIARRIVGIEMYSLYELSMCAAHYGNIDVTDLDIPKIDNPVCCDLVKYITVTNQSRTYDEYNMRIVYHYAIVFDCVGCLRIVHRSQLKFVDKSLQIHIDDMCFSALTSRSIECLKFSISAGAAWPLLACIIAINTGSAECLRYAISAGAPHDSNTFYSAVKSGDIELVMILSEFNCPICNNVYFSAVKEHRVDMLKYLIKLSTPDSYTFTMMYSMAIRIDFMECLEYLLTIDVAPRDPSVLTTMAIVSGNVGCLRVLLGRGLFDPTNACNIAVDARSLECLKFAHENGSPWDMFTCTRAVYADTVKCLKFAHENGCQWDARVLMARAISSNSVDCLEYVYENRENLAVSPEILLKFAVQYDAKECFYYMAWIDGFEVTESVAQKIVRSGNLNLLKYVHDVWPMMTKTESMWKVAAAHGYMDIIEYLFNIGCPRYEQTCDVAAGHGYLKCLKFLVFIGFKFTANTFARAVPNIECMQYLVKMRCPMTEYACIRAVRKGNVQALRFARENGCPWDYRTYREAYNNGNAECIEYVANNGCPRDLSNTLTTVME